MKRLLASPRARGEWHNGTPPRSALHRQPHHTARSTPRRNAHPHAGHHTHTHDNYFLNNTHNVPHTLFTQTPTRPPPQSMPCRGHGTLRRRSKHGGAKSRGNPAQSRAGGQLRPSNKQRMRATPRGTLQRAHQPSSSASTAGASHASACTCASQRRHEGERVFKL